MNKKITCLILRQIQKIAVRNTSLDGFEPSTFRLTAERANRLRHRDEVDGIFLPSNI